MQFNLSNNEDFIVQRGNEVVNIFDIEGGGGGDSTGKTDVTAFTAHTADTSVHFTGDEKAKLSSVASGANVNVQADWSQTGTTADDYIKNKPNIPDESTVSGWGFTKNAGTITGINMNGASKGTSGVVNLGTVITAETDPTVPAWAKESTKPSYTASEVGALPDSTVIPTALSALTDDATHRLVTDTEKSAWNAAEANVQSDWSQTGTTADDYIKNKPNIPDESTVSGWGFTKNAGTITGINMNGASKGTSGVVNLGTVITAETDPTVPAWAKESTKPSYTASEVGALPDSTVIPTALSALTDDATHRLVTDTEKSAWNGKASASDLSTLSGTVTAHTADTTIHVTSGDKTSWNGKADNTAFTAHTASSTVHVSTSEKNTWNGKADNTAFTAHTASTTVHVSTSEKNTWNGKADSSDLNTLSGTVTGHTADTTIHVTSSDKTSWNGKADNTAFTAHTASTSVHLPTVSSSDNGKVLMVVNGVWTLVLPSSIYSGSNAPSNSLGNNGDLYLQI